MEQKTYSVSELILKIPSADVGIHCPATYAQAMEGFAVAALSIQHVGGDVIAINLANGLMLKVTTRDLLLEVRPFDMPVLESGTRLADSVKVNYFIQPTGLPDISDDQYRQFVLDVAHEGFWFTDPGKRNVVFYQEENRFVLVDPWAVVKLRRPRSQTNPIVLKPLNAVSGSHEEIGRQISNFADIAFTFRGRRYASFEAFYQCLKVEDDKERARIAKLSGKEAKTAGRKLVAIKSTFDGKTFLLGSPEHHALLKEALTEKFVQNESLARAFAATRPRPIIHELGRPEDPKARFPAAVFVRILTEIREQLLERFGPTAQKAEEL